MTSLAPAPGWQLVVPGPRREHHPLPLHWSQGTARVVLPCVCGWCSTAERPETAAGSPAALLDQYRQHVAGLPKPCPECAAGKHDNCDGAAWDEAADDLGVCPCWQRKHLP